MPDFTKLWDTKYIFGPNPVVFSRSDYVFFYAAAAFVVIAIIAKVLTLRTDTGNPIRKLWDRFYHLLLTTGLLMLLWAGARYENIPWIGTHFVVLVLLLIAAVWLGFILWYRLLHFPHERRHFQEESTKQKYLQ